jgi:hypothetical protein
LKAYKSELFISFFRFLLFKKVFLQCIFIYIK